MWVHRAQKCLGTSEHSAQCPGVVCVVTAPLERADRVKAHVRQVGLIALGEQQLDVSALAQLVELSQTRAIAEALQLLHQVGRPVREHVQV